MKTTTIKKTLFVYSTKLDAQILGKKYEYLNTERKS